MLLPEGKYYLALQTPDGSTVNRRDVKQGHSEADRINFLAELVALKTQWERSEALREHLSINIVQA